MMKLTIQFVKYSLVGAMGAMITSYGNLLFLRIGAPEYLAARYFVPIPWALGFAIICAAVSNFTLNKFWTFR
ncbi:MAG: GtrA family protein [Nitrososphaerota archaeon]|nr:GtrA family protein [Nitrososphaerota archaeon]